jgi:1-deoxy-D-xylulose-5-phosphate reductoisomerase
MKKLIILGSTGSIGESTIAVARSLRECFRVVGLSCKKRRVRLGEQAAEFRPESVAIVDDGRDFKVEGLPGLHVYRGSEGLLALVEETDADIVVNGIAGASGLLPSLAALRSGKDLALANKESLVMAGVLVQREALAQGRKVLPVDSEHAALFSMLQCQAADEVSELILTASGGAFRDLPFAELSRVRLADALRHPTWKMGAKITVDSATMANKGLEVIEAHRLFGIALPRIRVLIHPQSLVHSLVRTVDGTLHAECSTPDMRIPIQNALTFPAVRANEVAPLDLIGKGLTFMPVDPVKYRMLDLAYRAADLSAAHPIVYNAANEVAVAAFMEDAIPFTSISSIVEDVLERVDGAEPASVEDVLAVDAEARRRAVERMKERAS